MSTRKLVGTSRQAFFDAGLRARFSRQPILDAGLLARTSRQPILDAGLLARTSRQPILTPQCHPEACRRISHVRLCSREQSSELRFAQSAKAVTNFYYKMSKTVYIASPRAEDFLVLRCKDTKCFRPVRLNIDFKQ